MANKKYSKLTTRIPKNFLPFNPDFLMDVKLYEEQGYAPATGSTVQAPANHAPYSDLYPQQTNTTNMPTWEGADNGWRFDGDDHWVYGNNDVADSGLLGNYPDYPSSVVWAAVFKPDVNFVSTQQCIIGSADNSHRSYIRVDTDNSNIIVQQVAANGGFNGVSLDINLGSGIMDQKFIAVSNQIFIPDNVYNHTTILSEAGDIEYDLREGNNADRTIFRGFALGRASGATYWHYTGNTYYASATFNKVLSKKQIIQYRDQLADRFF